MQHRTTGSVRGLKSFAFMAWIACPNISDRVVLHGSASDWLEKGLMSREFHTRRRVEFRDTDAAGIAHFSAFFFWMESAEHEWLRHLGVPLVAFAADGSKMSWPRVSVSCEYKGPLRHEDLFDIYASMSEIGTSSVTYQFRFELDGLLVACGRVVAVYCLLKQGQPLEAIALPDTVRDLLQSASSDS